MFQFISHFTDRFSYEDGISLVLEGGCKWVQLRMKDASAEQIEAVAAAVAPLCRESGATFGIPVIQSQHSTLGVQLGFSHTNSHFGLGH